jgi:hypothetical protein
MEKLSKSIFCCSAVFQDTKFFILMKKPYFTSSSKETVLCFRERTKFVFKGLYQIYFDDHKSLVAEKT